MFTNNTPTPAKPEDDSIPNESQNKDEVVQAKIENKTGVEQTSEVSTNEIPPIDSIKRGNFGLEILKIVALAIIIVTPIRILIAQPFVVSGASMDDTFLSGEYLIVDRLNYRFNEPERGDVIVFRFPLEQSKFFIKRVIGLPHDTVILQGKSTIIVNKENPEGFVLEEDYLSPNRIDSNSFSETLNDGEYFVMGDNRKESSDSRSWGVLDKKFIIGRAFVRLFPVTKFDILPGK